MIVLLAVWALAGLGCGILWADVLNQWNLPGTGYPLGFWFAHQGSILVFVVLILIYALAMDRLDRTLRSDVLAQAEREGNR
jgi:putative solute:sodium symporter small subunit